MLTDVAGEPVEVLFTPHLDSDGPRHLLHHLRDAAPPIVAKPSCSALYRDYYARAPFVRVVERLPATKDCTGTNFFDVTVRVVRGRIVVLACLDNLIRGASGVAVQNFNLMYGFEERTALM